MIVILADDMGFSDLGCYGGEIHTPHIDALAQQGVRFGGFTRWRDVARRGRPCSRGFGRIRRASGRMNRICINPAIKENPNYRCVTIAEVLRDAGYHTGMVGKWHLCHVNIARLPGPKAKSLLNFQTDGPISESKENWPTHRGFEEHWGTIPGVENYYDPYGLVHNEQTIKPDTLALHRKNPGGAELAPA